MSQPLVSIIINNYNYGQFLGQAIDSSLHQTYPHHEVIVVDDGSTDHSPDIIASYRSQIIPLLKPNGGQASSLNAGFAASQGDIIIFLDADDYLFPEAAAEVVAAWRPNVANVHYRLELVDKHGNYLDLYPAPEIALASGDVLPTLLKKGYYRSTVTSGNGFSRTALEHILPVPEVDFRSAADGYLVTLIPFFGPIVAIEKPLGAYRKHGTNVWSMSASALQVERFCKAVNHDFLKHKILIQKASELGYAVSPDMGNQDYLHLMSRIVSYRLDRQQHPVPSDTGLGLSRLGVAAIWRHTEFTRSRKLVLSGWFIYVGLLPRLFAEPAIAWLLVAGSRPKFIGWLLKQIRAVTRYRRAIASLPASGHLAAHSPRNQ